MTKEYLVVIEKGKTNYSAYSPDIIGCAATGKTVEETLNNMRDALEFHLESLLQDGDPIPAPKGLQFYLENTDEITSQDLIAHVGIEIPELAAV